MVERNSLRGASRDGRAPGIEHVNTTNPKVVGSIPTRPIKSCVSFENVAKCANSVTTDLTDPPSSHTLPLAPSTERE